jgi:hypothetical protein
MILTSIADASQLLDRSAVILSVTGIRTGLLISCNRRLLRNEEVVSERF